MVDIYISVVKFIGLNSNIGQSALSIYFAIAYDTFLSPPTYQILLTYPLWRDIFALRQLENVLPPVDDAQGPTGGPLSDIPAHEPPIIPKRLLGFLRVLVVPLEYVAAANAYLRGPLCGAVRLSVCVNTRGVRICQNVDERM